MVIEFGDYRIVPFNDLCWKLEHYRMTTPRGRHKDAAPEWKWADMGRYYSTLEGALKFAYEHGLKTAEGAYGLEDALAEARAVEKAIEKAAATATA